mgnify:CR=1 FL=1
MKLRAGLTAVLFLSSTAAHADMLALGEKGVKLSIQVDAAVPAGKALILANTFRGADVIPANTATTVEWHPLGGDLQIKLVASADADKLAPLRENLDRDAIKPISAKGIACGAPFPGIRTISETNPAEEVRWTYRATITGNKCSSELVKTEYLDAAGKPVAAPANTDIPPPSPPLIQPVPTKTDEPAKTDTKVVTDTKIEAPKAEAPKAESGCRLAAPSPPLALVMLLGLTLRRRRPV